MRRAELRRKSWLKRGTSRLARSAIKRKRRTTAEQAEKFEREYGSVGRVEWIAGCACLACGRSPCENAHTWNRGKGLKGPPESIVPLCTAHHRESHRGVRSFEAKYPALMGRTLKDWAAVYEARWQRVSCQVAA